MTTQQKEPILKFLNRLSTEIEAAVKQIVAIPEAGEGAKQGHAKDYEILAFRSTEVHPNAPGAIHKAPFSNTEDYLNSSCSVTSGHWEIYQVKRLSDDTVWTVGDEVQGESSKTKIKAFKIIDDNIFAYGINGYVGICTGWTKPAPDWEIVEFRATTSNYFDMHENTAKTGYCNGRNIDHEGRPLDRMLRGPESVEDGRYTIHAVRSKNGEVFRLGDAISTEHYGLHDITGFRIEGDHLIVVVGTGNLMLEYVRRLQTFTTADNVTVNEGDAVWYRYSDGRACECKALAGLNWANHYSTREAAERGSVLFVSSDGKPVYKGDLVWFWTDHSSVSSMSAIAGVEDVFTSRDAALAAYDAWLIQQPVLCLADIPKAMTMDDWEGLKQVVKEKLKAK